jgi:hypothetical protein
VEQGAAWANCYHNWNAVVNGGVGLAALATSDEDDGARQAYKLARANLERFFAALNRDGGWDEGTGYWGYAMRYVLLLAEAARRLNDDQSLLHRRGMDTTGLFPIYFTPNGQPASFGDMPSVPAQGTFYLLSRHFKRREVTWWLDTYGFPRDVGTTGWSVAGMGMLFRPPAARTPRKVALKHVKVVAGIGWAAMADPVASARAAASPTWSQWWWVAMMRRSVHPRAASSSMIQATQGVAGSMATASPDSASPRR